MAQQLIDSLSSDFEPSKYHDEYREKVLELIERKADGEEIAIQPRGGGAGEGPRPDGRARGEPRRGQGPRGGGKSQVGRRSPTAKAQERRQEVLLARQGRREEVTPGSTGKTHAHVSPAAPRRLLLPWPDPPQAGQGLHVPRRRRRAGHRARGPRADRRARHPAGVEGRLDLPGRARPPAGDGDRRRGPQAVPLPPAVAHAARLPRSSTR